MIGRNSVAWHVCGISICMSMRIRISINVNAPRILPRPIERPVVKRIVMRFVVIAPMKMLTWHGFRAHIIRSCCCGIGAGDIGLYHIAVARVSGTSADIMLLWHVSRVHRFISCCCGSGCGHSD